MTCTEFVQDQGTAFVFRFEYISGFKQITHHRLNIDDNVTCVKDVTIQILAGFVFRDIFILSKPSGFFMYDQV